MKAIFKLLVIPRLWKNAGLIESPALQGVIKHLKNWEKATFKFLEENIDITEDESKKIANKSLDECIQLFDLLVQNNEIIRSIQVSMKAVSSVLSDFTVNTVIGYDERVMLINVFSQSDLKHSDTETKITQVDIHSWSRDKELEQRNVNDLKNILNQNQGNLSKSINDYNQKNSKWIGRKNGGNLKMYPMNFFIYMI